MRVTIPASSLTESIVEISKSQGSGLLIEIAQREIHGNVDLTGLPDGLRLRFREVKFCGTVDLTGVELRQLTFETCEFSPASAPSVGGPLAAVGMRYCTVSGDVDFLNVTFEVKGIPFAVATDAEIGGTFSIDAGSTISGTCEHGIVQLIGTRMRRAEFLDARITNTGGATVQADGATVGHDVTFGPRFVSRSSGNHGGLRLLGAVVGGDIDCRAAQFVNDGTTSKTTGPALELSRAEVKNHILLCRGMSARSHSHHATVNMPGCTVGGDVNMDDSYVINEAPEERHGRAQAAVVLDGSRIGGTLSLRGSRSQSVSASRSTASCRRIVVGGDVDLRRGRVCATPQRFAVDLHGARIEAHLFLNADTACSGSSRIDSCSEKAEWPEGVPRPRPMTQARMLRSPVSRVVGSRPPADMFEAPRFVMDLVWRSQEWVEGGRVDLEYCSYSSIEIGPAANAAHHLDDESRTERVERLLRRDDDHEPSGYTQLAKSLDAAGDTREASKVRLDQQKDLTKQVKKTSWNGYLWRLTVELVVGYGLRPGRALGWLAALTAVSITFTTLVPGDWLVAAGDLPPGLQSEICQTSERITYGTGLALPLVTGSTDKVCEIRAGGGHYAYLAAGEILVQISGWLLASVFIAGVVGVIRPRDP